MLITLERIHLAWDMEEKADLITRGQFLDRSYNCQILSLSLFNLSSVRRYTQQTWHNIYSVRKENLLLASRCDPSRTSGLL